MVLRRLAALPSAPREVEELRAKAVGYLQETDAWPTTPPTVEEREKLMKRMLKVHVDVAKLERRSQ